MREKLTREAAKSSGEFQLIALCNPASSFTVLASALTQAGIPREMQSLCIA
jgi:hypothetical protein